MNKYMNLVTITVENFHMQCIYSQFPQTFAQALFCRKFRRIRSNPEFSKFLRPIFYVFSNGYTVRVYIALKMQESKFSPAFSSQRFA